MIKYKLICKDCNTKFDSWFASSNEYERLKKRKFLNCNSCNSLKVEKTLMTPQLINSKSKSETKSDTLKYQKIKKTIKNYQKFVKPEELKEILSKNNLSLKKLDGMHFNIIKDEWSITKDLSVNYIGKFLKN